MAIDLGSTNTSRYHSIPDSDDFILPDGDWGILALVYPQNSAATKYFFSTGGFGFVNSLNLYVYPNSSGGAGCKVSTAAEAFVSGTGLVMDEFAWIYATRRGAGLVAGQIQVGASSVTESGSVFASGSQNSTTAPNIGRRTDGAADRYWKGRWSQVAFISGRSVSANDMVALANGARILSLFGSSVKFLAHGRTANDATFTDIVGGHVLTRQGTSYGTEEDDLQVPYIWTPDQIDGEVVAPPIGTPIPVFVNHYRSQGIM